MDFIKYDTTLKASGDTYKKIVFWNRFLRNPLELILTILPAIASIVLISLGFFSTFLAILYAICWFYPIYIFGMQFPKSVKYHLAHREESEDAPCIMTITEKNITAEVPSHNFLEQYNWSDFTIVYDKYGYYMFFSDSKMIVMLNKADMPSGKDKEIAAFIKSCVNMNTCKVTF